MVLNKGVQQGEAITSPHEDEAVKKKRRLSFVCVSNQGRSVFSEFYFKKLMSDRDHTLPDRIEVTSAGFVYQRLKDYVSMLHIAFPEPFYNRPMSRITREVLRERGIAAPPEWRSKGLTAAMVEEADLIITALSYQKEDLLGLHRGIAEKIFTIREMSQQTGYLKFEDPTGLPKDATYWNYVENDPDYVRAILSEVEESLKNAFPAVLERLGLSP